MENITSAFSAILSSLLLMASLQCTIRCSFAEDAWTRPFRFSDCNSRFDGQMKTFLTVSSLVSPLPSGYKERFLELNWYGDLPQYDDQVALFDYDPATEVGRPLEAVRPSWLLSNFYRTNFQLPYFNFTEDNLTSECLGFWAGYFRARRLISSSCIKAEPFWMQANNKMLKGLRFRDLMIPGTHDSGSYRRYPGNKKDNIITRYKYDQEESVFNQLAYGIRYLDVRVGYYPRTKQKFWINHDFFRTRNSLSMVLDDVKRFLDITSEIIILDFHRFPFGFRHEPEAHQHLIEILLYNFKPYLIPRYYGRDVTLGFLWRTNKRLLIAYNHKMKPRNNYLWPGIQQMWGDRQSVSDLKSYFDNLFSQSLPKRLWSSMAKLTPTIFTILINPTKGLRGLADDVNRNVTRWFRDLWWKRSNIIATDYFLGNDIINVAIRSNRKRVLC
ncbi:PI-PLC X domain-containing protein 3-like [Limulus polyphemus]|uniref:PI-PLC X domain-containing protein 3-like n=1 Tax=Limulus polyphemus TaxID=6850 RepID=A0ABM1SY08_LIMPO|nr:PI-PLC X domain-containing protein 3-like [Limulus polyphemus]XP_022248515.1 PI-PLC X domain-containing protein 3-like [Limulus polyphemus]